MKMLLAISWGACLAAAAALAQDSTPPKKPTSGCIRCHEGIASIREPGCEMLDQILFLGRKRGDSEGCIVCHGGDPEQTEDKKAAHRGPDGDLPFYPDPGSPWINQKTCGRCHADHVRVQWHSLMMTEAGKIQGVMWSFGSMTGYQHRYGNYALKNPADPGDRLGTDAYRTYMKHLTALEPQVFVPGHTALPAAPTDLKELVKEPKLASFTYLRNQCLRCHHAVKGRQVRGDYRGMGCSSCHIPYSNEGFYEGRDKTIPRDTPGHPLVHTIQATRQAKVTIHGKTYSGIPIETCTTCHDRGKRIGVSFQGLMEIPYTSPYTPGGGNQPALHTKHYLAMHQDLHYNVGMLCQDCHTSIDVHSDGFIAAANLGSVQIECTDCHGTPRAYPWELPLGYGDEFAEAAATGPPRGTAKELPSRVRQGTIYPVEDGYLRTARGNAYSNAVRRGNKVIVHTAAGKELELEPLKLIEAEKLLSLAGQVAMAEIHSHIDTMECYACHAAWSPQCYGCHVKIDYSGGKKCFDWLGAGHRHKLPAHRADRGESGYPNTIPGAIEEQRSFTRWEDPILGVNGEGRVTPVAPGCQPSYTIVGADGKTILLNHIYRTMPDCEGAGAKGQLAIDISPTQPHTMTRTARVCESCHASKKALGYGIGGARLTRPPSEPLIVDLETAGTGPADRHILSRQARVQCEPIAGLTADWSRIVTPEGQQTQTVGHHFTRSRPLDDQQRAMMDRRGVCLACHREIPDRSLAVNLLHHVARATGQLPKTSEQHNSLLHKMLLFAGWGQVTAMVGGPLVVLAGGWWFWRRRKRKQVS